MRPTTRGDPLRSPDTAATQRGWLVNPWGGEARRCERRSRRWAGRYADLAPPREMPPTRGAVGACPAPGFHPGRSFVRQRPRPAHRLPLRTENRRQGSYFRSASNAWSTHVAGASGSCLISLRRQYAPRCTSTPIGSSDIDSVGNVLQAGASGVATPPAKMLGFWLLCGHQPRRVAVVDVGTKRQNRARFIPRQPRDSAAGADAPRAP